MASSPASTLHQVKEPGAQLRRRIETFDLGSTEDVNARRMHLRELQIETATIHDSFSGELDDEVGLPHVR